MMHTILIDDRVRVRRQGASQSHLGVQLPRLVELHVRNAEARSNLAASGSFTAKQPQQRSFPAAVAPDQADTHSGGDNEIERL